MESNLIDVEKNIYLDTLRSQPNYKTYLVSLFDIVSKKEEGDNKVSISRIIAIITKLNRDSTKEKRAHLLPILTSSELKKPYLYDILKEKFWNNKFIYIPISPDLRIFYHVYNCLVEELGFEIFEWALNKRKQAFENLESLESWFCEDKRTSELRSEIGSTRKKIDEVNSLEMIRLICDYFEERVILFFDDIDLLNQKSGQKNGNDLEKKAQMVFFEALDSFYSKVRNIIILIHCPKKVWNSLLLYSNNNLRNILEFEKVEFFDLEDFKRKMKLVVDTYWNNNNVHPPPNPFFPLNDKLLESSFEYSEGDLNHFFNILKSRIEDILSGVIPPEDLD